MWTLYGTPPGQRQAVVLAQGDLPSMRVEKGYRELHGWTRLSVIRS